ncbi:MAG: ABC transporter ATP-binding protein [Hydrogenophilales bacterium 16-64-46]|nr:MAG: ABC transporter ATP-binding protein [Hydrogenophilales bacterium 12-64-13]OYZ05853.1 MAG: ABC transporter ATP-binding protein [Hydrogenophilales bacterium 16-64-46]OZA39789.1 MAG: ABC transporter ATP-binding protein [Hydrogenophilales bacterium 17-64-34]HQS98668.1 ABC transporter ATP-binding protein [Thiobacillus sp.]
MTDTVLDIRDIHTTLGGNSIHRGLDLSVRRGEVVALIGGSGTGKSVLLREIIGLLKPQSGRIELFGQSVWDTTPAQMNALRRRFGVLFQDGALFSSLDVEDNVATPLFEHTSLPHATCRQLARLKLGLANLPADVAKKKPSELSGGMRKRVALARALALDPELLFLDEPTSGLDPISARAFDTLIRLLADSLGLTVFLVTHDLDTLFSIIDRVIVLSNGRVLGSGSVAELKQLDDPWLSAYFAARTPEETSPHGN